MLLNFKKFTDQDITSIVDAAEKSEVFLPLDEEFADACLRLAEDPTPENRERALVLGREWLEYWNTWVVETEEYKRTHD